MNQRLRGYIGDQPFILNYEDEQSPSTIAFRARAGGAEAPNPSGSFTYCDIGCGRGVTITTLAAANPQAEFIGIDPNPEHIREARAWAEAAGLTNIRFIENFIGKLGPDDLPALDFITANGVYSCIDVEEHARLRKQAARFLAPGGLFQVSYNMAAGCTQMEPLRRMMLRLAEKAEGNLAEKRGAAVQTIQNMAQAGHPFFEINPKAREIVGDWARRDIKLLAHTYFHADWHLHDPAEIIELFDDEGLGFCGPWDLDLMPVSQRRSFAAGHDPVLREALAATMRADTYRADVFRKGAPLTGAEPPALDDDMLFGPATAPALVGDPKEAGADEIAAFILEQGVATYGEIRDRFSNHDADERHIAGRIGRLIRSAWIRRYLSRPEPGAKEEPVKPALTLIGVLGENPEFVSNGAFVPAPAVGGGVFVPAMMLVLLTTADGPEAQWSRRAVERICAINRKAGRAEGDRNALADRVTDGIARFKRNWAPFLTGVGAARKV